MLFNCKVCIKYFYQFPFWVILIYNEVGHLKFDNIGFKEFLGVSYFM
jgi:hypothetical protein